MAHDNITRREAEEMKAEAAATAACEWENEHATHPAVDGLQGLR